LSTPVTGKPSRWLGLGEAPRWVRIALLTSLAINLLVIGALIGIGLSFRNAALLGSGQIGANFGRFVAGLPAERRGEVQRIAAAERPSLLPLRRDTRLARQALADALTVEPFDKARFLAAQQRVLELETEFRRQTMPMMASIAAALTPAERRSFLRWRGGHGPRWGGSGADSLGAETEPAKDGPSGGAPKTRP
jgi:uncharacterized membrane protein